MIIALCLSLRRRRQRRRRKHRWWVQPRLDRRELHDAFPQTGAVSHAESVEQNLTLNLTLRMDPHHFDSLQERVAALLPDRQDTVMRKCVSKAERFEVTIRFLASGDTYTSLSYLYRISRQTLGRIIPETCEAIYRGLSSYVKVPDTEEEWADIVKEFEERWHFPNCVGAMAGKYVTLRAPNNSNSNSVSYDSKGRFFHSLILLGLVDARCRFTVFDIGMHNWTSDAGVFSASPMAALLQNNTSNIPPPKAPGVNWPTALPHVVVADEVFPLKRYLMKPYPARGLTAEEAVFNHRLGRAQGVAENAFGVLVNRFAVLGKQMQLDPEVAMVVTQACVALHNYLLTENDEQYAEVVQREVQPQWFKSLGQQHGNHSTNVAQAVRKGLWDYIATKEAEAGQWDEEKFNGMD